MHRGFDELDDMRQPEGNGWMDIGFCCFDRWCCDSTVVVAVRGVS